MILNSVIFKFNSFKFGKAQLMAALSFKFQILIQILPFKLKLKSAV